MIYKRKSKSKSKTQKQQQKQIIKKRIFFIIF